MDKPTQGYGCMGLSALCGSAEKVKEDQAVAVFRHAVDKGVTLFNITGL